MRTNEIVSCGNDRTVRIYDTRTNHPVAVTSLSRASMTCLSVCGPDDTHIFAGSADGGIKMWDLRYDNVEPSMTYNGHTDRITGLIVVQKRGCMVTSSLDGTVRTWDYVNGECTQTMNPFKSSGVENLSLSFSSGLVANSPARKLVEQKHEGSPFSHSSNNNDIQWLSARSTCGKIHIWRS